MIVAENTNGDGITPRDDTKNIRIFANGCFDLLHFGHANLVRRAGKFGDTLVVIVHESETIRKVKGPMVFTDEERYEIARSLRWAHEVVVDVPYNVNILECMKEHNCDFHVHGDDIIAIGGKDAYAEVRDAGKLKEITRTQGVSTTDLICRILIDSTEHLDLPGVDEDETAANRNPHFHKFLPNVLMISEFTSNEIVPARPGQTIVYVAGAFDIFHIGHLRFLQKVKQEYEDCYLVVGLHSDKEVRRRRKMPKQNKRIGPVMNLMERSMTLLSIKLIDNVIIGAPHKITRDLMDSFKIDWVVHGSTFQPAAADGTDPFELPRKSNKLRTIDSDCLVTTTSVCQRIWDNREDYIQRNLKKLPSVHANINN